MPAPVAAEGTVPASAEGMAYHVPLKTEEMVAERQFPSHCYVHPVFQTDAAAVFIEYQ